MSLFAAAGLTVALGIQTLSSAEAVAAHSVTLVTTKTNAALGTYLVNAKGFTLYTFALDTNGKSACTGECATEWPPVLVPKGAKLSSIVHGVKASKLGKIKRPHGKFQLTYLGKPLYRFSADKKAGETGGQGLENAWSVATLTVAQATIAPAPVTPPSTPSSGSQSSSSGSGTSGSSTPTRNPTPPPTSPPPTSPPPTSPPPTSPPPTSPPPTSPPPTTPPPNPPTGGYGY